MRSLDIGATGMLAQQMNVEVTSHNIANMNTTAFQRRRIQFQDLLYQTLRRVGTQSSEEGTIVPSGVQVGLGVKPAAVYRITQQGTLVKTDNTYDMAIRGRGYFQVNLPGGGQGFTRDGAFSLSPEGAIVNADGYVLEPTITVPSDATGVQVNPEGQVIAAIQGQAAPQVLGQFSLTTFPNEVGLIAIGDNLYQATEASGAPNVQAPNAPGFGSLQQGFLENSNVNIVEEITQLISAHRAYDMSSKVIETSDQMLQRTASI